MERVLQVPIFSYSFPQFPASFSVQDELCFGHRGGHIEVGSGLTGLAEVGRCVVLPFDDKPGDKMALQIKGIRDCPPAYPHRSWRLHCRARAPPSCPKSPPARSLGECGRRGRKKHLCAKPCR